MANFSESATSARKVGKAMRLEQALQLRIDGRSFTEIAKAVGYAHRGNAQKLISEALDDLAAKSTENATQLRMLETERCNGIIRDADHILRDPEASHANKLRALEVKLKASESLRKLWGLDARAALDLTSGGAALPSVPELIEALRAAEHIEPDVDANNG